MVPISLGQDSILTDFSGIRQLLRFYEQCAQHQDEQISIRLDDLGWVDGNLCAILGAILYRLAKDNRLTFSIDAEQVSRKCHILFDNNFIRIDQDVRKYQSKTCIPYKGFLPKDKDQFADYLENELLIHQAMPKFPSEIKEKLIDDLTEVYANIDAHAETGEPFFVCGQYYPKKEMIHFTICDLGIGFFKKINERQPEKIKTCGDAILWAIDGNSTKTDAPGGSGLKNLYKYLEEQNGAMQIYTGDAGWCSRTMKTSTVYKNGISDLRNYYLGASINLEFNKKALFS